MQERDGTVCIYINLPLKSEVSSVTNAWGPIAYFRQIGADDGNGGITGEKFL